VDTQHHRASFDYTYVGDTHCQLGAEFHERRASEYYPALEADLARKFHITDDSKPTML